MIEKWESVSRGGGLNSGRNSGDIIWLCELYMTPILFWFCLNQCVKCRTIDRILNVGHYVSLILLFVGPLKEGHRMLLVLDLIMGHESPYMDPPGFYTSTQFSLMF